MKGLTTDAEKTYPRRIKLWKDFNHCWLALLQAQKEMSSNAGRSSVQSQNLIHGKMLKRMGDEIVATCDHFKDFNLVDYELGIWEEEIIDSEYSTLEFMLPGPCQLRLFFTDHIPVLLECLHCLRDESFSSSSHSPKRSQQMAK